MTFRISLPWPDRALSPNARKKWRKIQAVTQARNDAFLLARETLGPLWGTVGEPDLECRELQLRLVLYPPTRRHYDQDNTIAANKAALDGVCQALQIDDHAIKRTVIEWGDVTKGGEILLELSPIEDNLNGGKDGN